MTVRFDFVIEDYQRQYLDQSFFGHMIDGALKIWLNDQLYFQDIIALVEFAHYLNQWLIKANRNGQATPLAYYSIDNDEREGALLRLTPINAEAYVIESIWQKVECQEPLKHHDIKKGIEIYLQNLDTAVRG